MRGVRGKVRGEPPSWDVIYAVLPVIRGTSPLPLRQTRGDEGKERKRERETEREEEMR